MMNSQTATSVAEAAATTERIIRCRHCGRQTSLQLISIPNTDIKWILFNYPGGKLHHCIVKSLNPGKERLIQNHLEQQIKPINFTSNTSNPNHTNYIMVEKLDAIIEILNQIKENIISSDHSKYS